MRVLAYELPESLGGRLEFGLQTALVGVTIVFGILLLLMCVIFLFQLFSYTLPQRKHKRVPAAPPDVPASPASVAPEDDTELIAVLSAAVAAYAAGTDGYVSAPGRYRIRSFRRLN